jgi:hypothetical protein
VLGIGSLLLGVILMFVWQAKAPAYFRGQTLPKRAADELLLADDDQPRTRVALPDSGEMKTVIAPDLSNLPPGQRVVRRSGEPSDEQDERD